MENTHSFKYIKYGTLSIVPMLVFLIGLDVYQTCINKHKIETSISNNVLLLKQKEMIDCLEAKINSSLALIRINNSLTDKNNILTIENNNLTLENNELLREINKKFAIIKGN